MLIQERVQLIIKMHNLTAALFADKIGVQRSNVSHILSGRNKPGLDFLEKILISFPRVNAHWLITGSEQVNQSELKVNEPESKVVSVESQKVELKTVVFYSDDTYQTFYPIEK